jgi:hypothetical protein
MKTCTKCGESKPFTAFSIDRRKADALCVRCKECRRKAYESDKGTVAAAAKRWYEANKSRHGELSRAYYRANAEQRADMMAKWYRENKEKVAANVTAYRSTRPGFGASLRATRRAKERQATPKWANSNIIQSIYAEAARFTRETGIEHHVDHIVPILSKIVCGLHWEGNLRVIPGLENISKSNRHWPDMP